MLNMSHVEHRNGAVGKGHLTATADDRFRAVADIAGLARSEGLEPPTSGFEARRSIQLS
jgi:hypothetical protein